MDEHKIEEFNKNIIEQFNSRIENSNEDGPVNYVHHLHSKYIGYVKYLTLDTLKYLLDHIGTKIIDKIFEAHYNEDNYTIIEYLQSNYYIDFNNLNSCMFRAIDTKNLDKINYLIDNGYNIYIRNDLILERIIGKKDIEYLDFFVTKGLIISDNVIFSVFYKFESDYSYYIQFFVEIGIEYDRIANVYLKYLLDIKPHIFNNLLKLTQLGIDITSLIVSYKK